MDGLALLCSVTDDARLERLRASIDALECPAGFEVRLFETRNATSLAVAYNQLLEEAADWRYKAYVHQDVVILNRNLIADTLRVFERRTVALIGAAGCKFLRPSLVWWDGSGVFGRVVHLGATGEEPLDLEQPAGAYETVEAVDGLCMITQHDLRWDEAIPGFHFYDVAQSTRFVLAGYDVVVPRQKEPWFAHDETPRETPESVEYLTAREAFRERYWQRQQRFQRSRFRRRARRLATRLRVAV
jgi:Glycosyltransferase like family